MGYGEGKGVGQTSDLTLEGIVVDDSSFPLVNGNNADFERRLHFYLTELVNSDERLAEVRDVLTTNPNVRELHIAVGCPNYLDPEGSFLIYSVRKGESGRLTLSQPLRKINPMSTKRLTDRLAAVHEDLTSYSNGFGSRLLVLPRSYYERINARLADQPRTQSYNLGSGVPQQKPQLAGSGS